MVLHIAWCYPILTRWNQSNFRSTLRNYSQNYKLSMIFCHSLNCRNFSKFSECCEDHLFLYVFVALSIMYMCFKRTVTNLLTLSTFWEYLIVVVYMPIDNREVIKVKELMLLSNLKCTWGICNCLSCHWLYIYYNYPLSTLSHCKKSKTKYLCHSGKQNLLWSWQFSLLK